MRRAAAGTLAVALAVMAAGTAATAQSSGAAHPVDLPLTPPAAAHPLVADFVAVCTRAVVDPVAGAAEARARGYVAANAEGALANPVADVLRATAGFSAFAKDGVNVTFVRSAFPHAVVMSCNMMTTGGAAMIDSAVLTSIPGVEGAVVAQGTGRIGRWSMIDRAGEVSLVTETAPNDRYWQLSMTRAVRTERGTAHP